MTFYAVPDVDAPGALASDFTHVQNTHAANEQVCDALSRNASGTIWAARRSYAVEGMPFYAVIFCDEANDDYQVAITDVESEALEEYRAVVLGVADQNVDFTTSDLDRALLTAARAGKPVRFSKRPSFIRV